MLSCENALRTMLSNVFANMTWWQCFQIIICTNKVPPLHALNSSLCTTVVQIYMYSRETTSPIAFKRNTYQSFVTKYWIDHLDEIISALSSDFLLPFLSSITFGCSTLHCSFITAFWTMVSLNFNPKAPSNFYHLNSEIYSACFDMLMSFE